MTLLSLLTPLDRRPYQRRELLAPSERVDLWVDLLDDYRQADFSNSFPLDALKGETQILLRLAFLFLFEMGNSEQALEAYTEGLAAADRLGNPFEVLNVLKWKKSVHWFREEYQEIIVASERQIQVVREIISAFENNLESSIDSSLASLTQEEKEYILEYLQSYKARVLYDIGTTYLALGQPQKALEFYEESSGIDEDCFCILDYEVNVPINLGVAYWLSGQYEKASSVYENLLNVTYSPLNFPVILASRAYTHLAQYQDAIEFYEQSLDNISNTFSGEYGKIAVLYNLGYVYMELGQYQKAVDSYNEALEVAQEYEDRFDWEGIILAGLGRVYLDSGDLDRAVEILERAIPNIDGVIYELIEKPPHGPLDGFMAGQNITTRTVLLHWQSSSLSDLANAYFSLESYSDAIDLFERSLEISNSIGDVSAQSVVLRKLGNVYGELDRYEQSFENYQKALAIAQNSGLKAEEAKTFSDIGKLLRAQAHPELAIIFLKASVEVRESIREDIRGLDIALQQSFTDTIADDYRLLADLLLQQGRIPEAQQVLDLLKLEELREFTDTRAVWTSDGLQLTAAEQTVADAHGSLIALGADVIECERTNCPDLETLYDRQQTLLTQYDREVARFTATIRDNRGDDGIFQDPESISGDAQDLLEAYAAEGETALLIYPFVLEDKLWLVWATVGNVIGSIEVPVARGELSATVQRLGELLQTGDTRNIAELQATNQQLYDWLIAPLEGELAANDIDHLVFVNDRVTRYIPMAVLHDGEQYLLERYTLSTVLAPGATEMGDRLGPVPETPVLGLGVTRPIGDFNALPAVGPELAAIVQGPEGDGVYPGQVFLDEAFTLDALERNVAAHRVLHIATHAEFVPGRKEESYILLGDGSPLRIPDIERIERRLNNLHLVVLSACQTALGGPDQDGAEIAGLSSYFLEARRAEAVIASLWSVNDTSTSVLMQRFYALLATGDFTKSEALRQAQLSLLNGEDLAALADRLATTRAGARPVLETGTELPPDLGHRHLYHWAPFILIGNGL
jgi:CHAT domain-containing protein/tetratricopeptide (TPR) repeat protein